MYGSSAKTKCLAHACPGQAAYPYKHSRSGPVQTFAYFGTRFLPGNVCTGKPFGPIFGRMFVRVGLSSSRLTRTNIFWAQKNVWTRMFVRVGFSGKCLAREIHQNVCTGRVLLICVRMFVRVGCTRPVQTFRGPNIAPPPRGADPYKHSTYKHPEERARRRGAGPLLPEKCLAREMFGPRDSANVCTGRPKNGSAINVCTSPVSKEMFVRVSLFRPCFLLGTFGNGPLLQRRRRGWRLLRKKVAQN